MMKRKFFNLNKFAIAMLAFVFSTGAHASLINYWGPKGYHDQQDKKVELVKRIQVFPPQEMTIPEGVVAKFADFPGDVMIKHVLPFGELTREDLKTLKAVSRGTYVVVLRWQKVLLEKQTEAVRGGLNKLSSSDYALFLRYKIPLINAVINNRDSEFNRVVKAQVLSLKNNNGLDLSPLCRVTKPSKLNLLADPLGYIFNTEVDTFHHSSFLYQPRPYLIIRAIIMLGVFIHFYTLIHTVIMSPGHSYAGVNSNDGQLSTYNYEAEKAARYDYPSLDPQ